MHLLHRSIPRAKTRMRAPLAAGSAVIKPKWIAIRDVYID